MVLRVNGDPVFGVETLDLGTFLTAPAVLVLVAFAVAHGISRPAVELLSPVR